MNQNLPYFKPPSAPEKDDNFVIVELTNRAKIIKTSLNLLNLNKYPNSEQIKRTNKLKLEYEAIQRLLKKLFECELSD